MSDQAAPLRLKKNEERRLKAGHAWVFSNEIDASATPLSGFEPGQRVQIQENNGRALGEGYVNPHSLISARLVSRDHRYPFDASLIVHRIKVALSLRERLFTAPFYRLVFGESDGLPGVVVDRFDDVLVMQITTAGMERCIDDVVAALTKVVHPRAILLRNDSPIRKLEGLESYVRAALGEPDEEIEVLEGGARFRTALIGGQKTGWFYDQCDNRAQLPRYVKDARVLDVFSYAGAWGIQAALAGAQSVTCVDESQGAIDYVRSNAQLNAVQDRVQARQGEAFAVLREMREARERFDVVVIDPPAFIKRKKDMKEGVQAYRRLNQLAMQVLAKDGLLISCSCSHHLKREVLLDQMNGASRHVDREMRVLQHGYQSVDHPMHPAIPETEYLKVVFARVIGGA